MSDYTPELGEVREAYAVSRVSDLPTALELVDSGAEFDRLIAKVKADAWDEGETAGLRRADYEYGQSPNLPRANPYREEDGQ